MATNRPMKRLRDTPLAEITLRRYERPYELTGRELVRKFCLSVGLLQPGDSRDVIVDILYSVILHKQLTSRQIEHYAKEIRKENNIALSGIAGSNVRRQIKRLRDMFILQKKNGAYTLCEETKLIEIFEEKIERFLVPSILGRVKEYFAALDKMGETNTIQIKEVDENETNPDTATLY